MSVNACYLLFMIIISNFYLMINGQNEMSDSEKHLLFPLLGYLHGFKIGQNFGLKLPPLVLSPILIVPTVNQQQSAQNSTTDENYEDPDVTHINGNNISLSLNELNIPEHDDEKNDIQEEDSFKINDNTDNNSENDNISNSDTSRQVKVDGNTNNSTIVDEFKENSDTTPYDMATNSEIENFDISYTTEEPGPYPSAAYNNSDLDNLSITVAPIVNNLTLPNTGDTWQNFSVPTLNDMKNITSGNNSNHIIFPVTDLPLSSEFGLYPPRRYNENVDRLSITTNSYTNEESLPPSAHDDRWQSFSSLKKSYLTTSGFRPLAGLYYDGFLHQSLNKQVGFIPI